MLHGWLILDKPLGLGSTQGVGAVKRALREGGYPKAKVGHGGTLDPLATGVLPIAIGEATKLAGRMLDSDKIYDFTIAFGVRDRYARSRGQGRSRKATVRPTHGAGRGDAAALHRPDQPGAARLFGAEGGWRARLRSGAGGRGR